MKWQRGRRQPTPFLPNRRYCVFFSGVEVLPPELPLVLPDEEPALLSLLPDAPLDGVLEEPPPEAEPDFDGSWVVLLPGELLLEGELLELEPGEVAEPLEEPEPLMPDEPELPPGLAGEVALPLLLLLPLLVPLLPP